MKQHKEKSKGIVEPQELNKRYTCIGSLGSKSSCPLCGQYLEETDGSR